MRGRRDGTDKDSKAPADLPRWALKRALRHEDLGVRQQALIELARADYPKAIELIKVALDDQYTVVRTRAVLTLKEVGTPEAIDLIVKAMTSDRHPFVRARAADMLGEMEDPRLVQHLCLALEDFDDFVASSAARAIAKLGGPDVGTGSVTPER